MSAAMSSEKYHSSFLLFAVFMLLLEAYKLVDIEIDLNPGGEPPKIFTKESIAEFDASDPDKPIYLAVRGVVFDVTSGKDFYNKQSEYNALTGKDASRAHATWSLDPKDLIPDLNGLTDDQLHGLDMVYQETYKRKYPVVGYMDYLITQQDEGIKKRFTNEEL